MSNAPAEQLRVLPEQTSLGSCIPSLLGSNLIPECKCVSASVNWKLHFCLSSCFLGSDSWTPVCIGIKGQKNHLACLPEYFFLHFSFFRTTQRYAKGSREMAEPLGAFVVLTGDSSSVLSIHMVAHNHHVLVLGGVTPSSSVYRYCMHVVHVHTCRQPPHV